MTYRLIWLKPVLSTAGLKVAPVPGWEDRGLGDAGEPRGVICHHTAGSAQGIMPSLNVVTNGRPARPGVAGLRGPLSQLGLGRDGTFFLIAAGFAQHAGPGRWEGIDTGNSSFIGIEAENCGTRDAAGLENDPWPAVQSDALRRGVAAILTHIGANSRMCCGHKEFALPDGRKDDPPFDMTGLRNDVASIMAGTGAVRQPIPAADQQRRPTMRRGDSGDLVGRLQAKLGEPVDGLIGGHTEAAIRAFQRAHQLVPDGIVGPATWQALDGAGPP